ncbi:MAG TPA: DNA translocase FtsK [Spirochaetia bacterium]|nr:DNA translocase FtsK [Spirochaetia bacterium]
MIAFGRRLSPAVFSIVVVLGTLCLFCVTSLGLHLAGVSGPAGALGRFLIEGFSWAGFFVPAYFLAGAALLLAPVFRRRSALLLMFSIVPFITLSLLFHVLSKSTSTLPQLLLDSFGMVPSALLLFLLLALETIFLFTLPHGASTAASMRQAARTPLALPYVKPADSLPVMIHEELDDLSSGAPTPLDPALALHEAKAVPEALHAQVEDEPAAEQAGFEEESAEPDAVELVPVENVFPLRSRPGAPAVMLTPGPTQEELPFPKTGNGAKAYNIPVHDVLKSRGGNEYWIIDDETRRASKILTDALKEFNIDAEVTGIRKGPVITLFEVLPAQGVRISKIANLSDNIALRLAAPSVRIVAPIPGRNAVGIEVPNRVRSIVSFKEMISLDVMQKSPYEIPLALGKDILGEAQVIDLIQTPHLLIGGATNSGKSVLVNSIICSILFRKSPDEVRLFLIDPKIVELKLYNGCPHLLTPVITDPKKAFQALQYCISEMERRYTLLDALGVRDIRAFNKKAKKERVQRLPYIVIVIDEFADLMATTGKELESTLARLAAMARAVGIHMVLATQRPSIDVITGLIKANIPSRIAFMVANKFDSRIIIDAVGAEKLLGKGDMLFSAAWNPFPTRIQGAYIDDDEIDAVTDYVKKLGPPQYIDDEVFFDDEETNDFEGEPGSDPLFERALEIIVSQGKASASYLQRRLKVGYNRAARLVEEMEMRGIVGPAQGSRPREIIHVPSKGA